MVTAEPGPRPTKSLKDRHAVYSSRPSHHLYHADTNTAFLIGDDADVRFWYYYPNYGKKSDDCPHSLGREFIT